MTDRPIIFSAPMTRALLDGRKTMTRRVINRHPTLADWPDLRPTHWQPLPAPPSNIKNP